MSLQIVPLLPNQTEEAGRLVYESFLDLSSRHAFDSIFESCESCVRLVRLLVRTEGFTRFLALESGRPAAVNFLDERDEVAGVGPVAVAVGQQGRGYGRKIMEALLDRAEAAGFRSVRLIQQGYNRPLHALTLALIRRSYLVSRHSWSAVQAASPRRRRATRDE